MKLFVVLCVLFGITFGFSRREDHLKCLQQNNMDVADLRRLSDEDTVITTNFKCYLRCLMLKAEVLSPTGRVNVDKFSAKVSSPETLNAVKPIVTSCFSVVAQGLCEYEYQFMKCLRKHDTVGIIF